LKISGNFGLAVGMARSVAPWVKVAKILPGKDVIGRVAALRSRFWEFLGRDGGDWRMTRRGIEEHRGNRDLTWGSSGATCATWVS